MVTTLVPPLADSVAAAVRLQPQPARQVRPAVRRALLLIDPQFDFGHSDGALFVPGGDVALERVAQMLLDKGGAIGHLVVTTDWHPRFHIGHTCFFVDATGRSPDPFTVIRYEDFTSGRWQCRNPVVRSLVGTYLKTEEAIGRVHQVWPPHCLIGSPGAAYTAPVGRAVCDWETRHAKSHEHVQKGTDPLCEQFSAVTTPALWLNKLLVLADEIGIAGLARSHCVAATVRDILRQKPNQAAKLVLLSDGMADVPGSEIVGDEFVREMTAAGVRVRRTDTWL